MPIASFHQPGYAKNRFLRTVNRPSKPIQIPGESILNPIHERIREDLKVRTLSGIPDDLSSAVIKHSNRLIGHLGYRESDCNQDSRFDSVRVYFPFRRSQVWLTRRLVRLIRAKMEHFFRDVHLLQMRSFVNQN